MRWSSRSATGRCGSPTRTGCTSRPAAQTKLDLVHYYLVGRRRHRPRAARAAVHAAPLPRRASPARRCTRSGCRTARRRGCETVRVHFPRYGRHADELCVTELAERDLGGADVDGRVPPVELAPGRHRAARRVAHRPRPDAATAGSTDGAPGRRTSRTRCSTSWAPSAGRRRPAARACTSTCGSSRDWGFADVRRAALAFAREVERRAPDDVTTTWWRKDRDPTTLFVDYNQNARDHTIASAYSVRGVPEATVSTPITWDEIDDVDPQRLHHRDRARPLRRARRPARGHRRRRLSLDTAAGVGRPRRPRPGHALRPATGQARLTGASRGSIRCDAQAVTRPPQLVAR